MSARHALVGLALVVLVGGCTAQRDLLDPSRPPASPAISRSPGNRAATPIPQSSPIGEGPGSSEPAPTIMPSPGDGPTAPDPFAQLERDAIRLSLQIERNPMLAGAETWARTIVTNDSNRVLHWGGGACSVAVWVRGSMAEVRWRAGERPTSQQLDLFKDLALDQMLAGGPEQMGFLPDSAPPGVDLEDFGCGDMFVGHDLPPGASIIERHHWDGTALSAHSPMPAGRLDLVATFGGWWRGADTPDHHGEPLELHLDAWVSGVRDPPRLDPAEAIDAAIADPVFGPWLETRGDLRNAQRPFVRYDAERHIWRVGLIHYNPTRTRVCNVDADSGEVVSITGSVE